MTRARRSLWVHVVNRNPNRAVPAPDPGARGGAVSVYLLVILVPVLLGMMGFAVDLGRLWLIRGELNQAASAMAFAAAQQLNGTSAATDAATAAANASVDGSLADSNKYNFGSIVVGQSTATLTSTVPPPAFFGTLVDAITAYGQPTPASTVDGTQARHVTVSLAADAPLLFWSLLSLGQARKTTVAASAVAGVSAPVCMACGIAPFVVADLSAGADPVDFGFVDSTLYTMRYQCTGANGANGPIAGTTAVVPYAIVNRLDPNSTFAEDQQLYRVGAQGLGPSTSSAIACSNVGSTESLWATTPQTAAQAALGGVTSPTGLQACALNTPNLFVEDALCGVSTRLSDTAPTACANNSDLSALATAYAQDIDMTPQITDYTGYVGNNRRLLTLPVVDTLATLNVLGFRQFLLQYNDISGTVNNPADGPGRFVVMYLDPNQTGAVAPVPQGSIAPPPSSGFACSITSGPGKVILHQ
jgi:Flp pilus assembly protein TadG